MVKPGDIIPVKFSEDTAQFADLRPVRRQPMALHELVGLVLTSTGKQPERVRERLARGTCTYNIYRYWWEGFAIDDATLAAALAGFPDPDPTRAFVADRCEWMRLVDDSAPIAHSVLVERGQAGRGWFRRQSFWDVLLTFAARRAPDYLDYSYYHQADLYRLPLAPAERARLLDACRHQAPRSLSAHLQPGLAWVALELACRR